MPIPDLARVGTIYGRYMPSEVRAMVEARARGRLGAAGDAGGACIEYTGVAQGHKDFCVYYRLLPWDHAPGALILREANGVAEHLDGTSYKATSDSQVTIVARSRGIADRVRRVLSTGDAGHDA